MRISRSGVAVGLAAAVLLVACTGSHSEPNADSPEPAPSAVVAPAQPATQSPPSPPNAPAQEGMGRVVINRYRAADLLAGRSEPADRWWYPLSGWSGGFSLSPDGEKAVVYNDELISSGGPRPVALHLATGETRPLPDPNNTAPYVYIGWLPDGNLLLVSPEHVWLGGPMGEHLKEVAAVRAWKARLSPDGRLLALWQDHSLQILDLVTGVLRQAKAEFREGPDYANNVFAWAPDGAQLAATDFDGSDSGAVRTRLLDPLTGEQVRTLEGDRLVAWMADGSLLVWRTPRPDGNTLVLLDPAGGEKLLAGYYAQASPDGKFLMLAKDGKPLLMEVGTGKSVFLAFVPVWTDWSDLLVITLS